MFDLFRFHYRWLDVLNGQVGEEVRVGEYLEREGYGDGFKEDYLLVSHLHPLPLPAARSTPSRPSQSYLQKDTQVGDGLRKGLENDMV